MNKTESSNLESGPVAGDAPGPVTAVERSPTRKLAYRKPVLTRHGKVTDLTLGGSPSASDLESDGSIGRFGTPK